MPLTIDDVDIQIEKMRTSIRTAYRMKEWDLMHFARGYLTAMKWVRQKILEK